MREYELFNHEDHTECLLIIRSDVPINVGDLVQYGLPKQLEYRVVGRKFIIYGNGLDLGKVVLYVERLYMSEELKRR